MPQDLFGDVVVRRSSTRSRRSSVAVVSVIAHAAALVTFLIVPLFATGALPLPQRKTDYILPRDITPVVPPAPRLARPTDARRTPATAGDPRAVAAPLVAPTGIAPEDPLTTGPRNFGVVGSLEPPGVEGIGSNNDWRGELPPPPPPQVKPMRVSNGIRAPQKIVDVAPIYPAMARQAGVQGVVIIEATIDVRGNVEAARVLKSNPLLDQAALDAVRQWKFSRTLLSGVPVPIIMTVTVIFTLH